MARGLNWQTLQLSLAGGLETKGDVRAADSRQLDIARDVKFDENDGVQTRLPFGPVLSDISGGGSIANARRIEAYGDELVLFTADSAFTWNAQLSKWVPRGTHLAVAVDETPRFVTTGDQIDGDRAECNGCVVFAWTEAGQVFAAALDKISGAVLVAPTAVSTAVGRPRLVALAFTILLFTDAGLNTLTVRAIDPLSPSAGISGPGSAVLSGAFDSFYDVVRAGSQDLVVGVCRRTPTTSYTVFRVTPALAVTTATKARVADGPVAVATIASGTQTQVVRGNGTNVQGDLLTTSTLADVFTGQAIGTVAGTPINQIAAAFASTTCTAFWSAQENTGATFFSTKSNTVTTGNVVGAEAQFINQLGVASRAFERDGRVYVWLAFAGDLIATTGVLVGVRAQLQNTYFLYRDDRLLVSKAAFDVAGGFAASTGRLPGVSSINGNSYSFAATFRRRIDVGGTEHAALDDARSIKDIEFTFDSNAARRCVGIGSTLYVSGGIVLQYDGFSLTETGFLVYPWSFGASAIVGAPGGAIPAGAYTYKGTLRWQNGRGEQERSTTALGVQVAFAATGKASLNIFSSTVTLKQDPRVAAIEIWRTAVNPVEDSPFFLVTSKNPAAVGDNGYVANGPQGLIPSFTDNFTDAILTTKETNPENGSALESLAPPGAKIIFATDTRIFLGGLSGDPDSVAYSRLRGVGEIASFHDGNVFSVPSAGGPMTAIATINETLVVFRESAIYAFPGQGFDNLGQGLNFGPPTQISSDVGAVSAESVALTPMGLIFKSLKGWYLATLSGVRYIGAAVAAFDSDVVRAVHVMGTEHEVRILTSGRLLAWDYQAITESAPMGQWSERTIFDGVHATIWNGQYVYLTPTGPRIEQTEYIGVDYGLDVETAWIKAADLQGAVRVRALEVLGEFRSDFLLRVRVARDYQYDGGGNVLYYDDVPWSPSPQVIGSALQHRHMPSQGACEAIKVRLTAVAAGDTATLPTGALSGPVATSGTNWDASFRVIGLPRVGEAGNACSMSLGFELGSPDLVDVRDHFRFDPAVGRWQEDVNNIGVRVVCGAASLTANDLAGLIQNGTALAQIALNDPDAAKTINGAFMNGQFINGDFSGGTYIAPDGEACKLTGLALEVGIKPGLHRRLSAEQKGA